MSNNEVGPSMAKVAGKIIPIPKGVNAVNAPGGALYVDHYETIPKDPVERIDNVMEWPLKHKENVIPLTGTRFWLGPYLYEVTYTNPSKLRGKFKLIDLNMQPKPKPGSRMPVHETESEAEKLLEKPNRDRIRPMASLDTEK